MKWFARLFDKRTILDMRHPSRSLEPGRVWRSRVYYDAWGAAYAGDGRCSHRIRLRPDGTTEDYINMSEWKHRSGPPVQFTEPPTHD